MINRGNWLLVNNYLEYRDTYDQLSNESLREDKKRLRYLLEWADKRPFDEASKIIPVFPEIIKNLRSNKGGNLSREYQRKIIGTAKHFLLWLTIHKKGYRNKINPVWLETLKTAKGFSNAYVHEFVTIEEMTNIVNAPVYSLRDQRIKASASFWFLSGIRIKAFTTLPIKAIDLDNLSVKQWPSLGVQTKNNKSATTFLLNIEPILKVIREWDKFIRENLPENSFWFAPLSPNSEFFDSNIIQVGENRDHRARLDLKEWMLKVNLPYHSPHKFRHGFAVYALKKAQDMGDFKAISQNMMHSNLSITDGIYGIFSEEEVKNRITGLNNLSPGGKYSDQELDDLADRVAERLVKK